AKPELVLLVESVWKPSLASGARLARWSEFLVVKDAIAYYFCSNFQSFTVQLPKAQKTQILFRESNMGQVRGTRTLREPPERLYSS
ncbi:MAG TPA: hypothetical protein DCE56_09620, partial [Cyanobacteria bacterium UBA8553]|nr:hypothetical protein [Cyanobacteria bacterium UBA8553]